MVHGGCIIKWLKLIEAWDAFYVFKPWSKYYPCHWNTTHYTVSCKTKLWRKLSVLCYTCSNTLLFVSFMNRSRCNNYVTTAVITMVLIALVHVGGIYLDTWDEWIVCLGSNYWGCHLQMIDLPGWRVNEDCWIDWCILGLKYTVVSLYQG